MTDAQVQEMIKLLRGISRELKHSTLLLEMIRARLPDADEYANVLSTFLPRIQDATHAHSD
jgi:hypothetical protein